MINFIISYILGVSTDHKPLHPELALTLTIRDKLINYNEDPNEILPPIIFPTIPEEAGDGLPDQMELLHQDISIKYLEEGFIQIGDAKENSDNFILSFMIDTAYNLDLLLRLRPVYKNEPKFCITLTFFDLTISSKEFYKDLHEPILLNDKIMFKLYSSVDYLVPFFEKYKKVDIKFVQGTEVLGTSIIDLQKFKAKDFFKDENNLRTKYEQDCMFRSTETNKIPEGVTGRKPFVSTQTALLRNKAGFSENDISNKIQNKELFEIKTKTPRSMPDLCQGDQNFVVTKVNTSDMSVQTSARAKKIASSFLKNLKEVARLAPIEPGISSYDDAYHLYSLSTSLQSITWKNSYSESFQFKFLHPKVNTVLVVQCNTDNIESDETITLLDVNCLQYFISSPTNISTLIYTYPCKLQILDENNEPVSEEFEVYTRLFLSINSRILIEVENSCSYIALVRSYMDEDVIAEVEINMVLKDLGNDLEYYERTCYDLEPIILDEKLTFKTLRELEKWKDFIKQHYEERQKCLQNETLKLLSEDWEKKREELERKLLNGVERCRVLSEELMMATYDLDKKKVQVQQQLMYRDNPEVIEIKVTQMIEAEMNKKLDDLKHENLQLLKKIDSMQQEQIELKQEITKKETEYEELKRVALTEEQTKSLFQDLRSLEEKYRQEQNAKAFFKEQWQKAVREVHVLKSEDQKEIQMQIKKKKIELSQLSLTDFDKLSSEGSEASLMSCPGNDVTTSGFVY